MTQSTREITPVVSSKASPAGGHYSQAVTYGGLVYVSGQLGFDPGTSNKTATDVEQEARNCMTNLAAILAESGSGLSRLVMVTIYITDVSHWPTVNKVFAEFMGDHKPARAIVPCRELHHGFNVEIAATAAV